MRSIVQFVSQVCPPSAENRWVQRAESWVMSDRMKCPQDYIAEQTPVIFTPNFPIRLFEVSKKLGGFEPVNPFGMISPENWYYIQD